MDRLTISIDTCGNHTCLIVGRKRRGKFEVVNELYDEEAKRVYKQLTGRSI